MRSRMKSRLAIAMLGLAVGVRAANLPEGYEGVEKLVVPAGKYVDTRYKPNWRTIVKMDVFVQGETECWLGVEGADGKAFCAGNGGERGVFLALGGQIERFFRDGGLVPAGRHTLSVGSEQFGVGVETWLSYPLQEKFQLDDNLFLFALNRERGACVDRNQGDITFYSCMIFEGSIFSIKRSFVPCRNPQGASGLYDLVEGRFYPLTDRLPLPANYTQVEYIESTTGGGQYIDTGYVPTANTRIVADLDSMARSQNWAVFFGVTGNDSASDGVLLRYTNASDSPINAWFCGDSGAKTGFSGKRLSAELKSGSLALNGTANTFSSSGTPYNGPIYIFCGNNGGAAWRHQAMKLYSFKIYEGNVLKRDFVPCIRNSDRAVGLYDTENGHFHANAGSGCFGVPESALPFGRELASGIYTISNSFAYVAAAGESALKVANGADVTLVIPEGVEVTLRGGDAVGTTGAGAGIEVPANAKLTIEGEGRLFAYGGKAANGANGGAGGDGTAVNSSGTFTSGAGGAGGNGGGGAGAGIGGKGGNGGNGGAGGASVSASGWAKTDLSGKDGQKGGNGGNGGTCGAVTIEGSMTVVAKGGAAGADGDGGAYGKRAVIDPSVFTYGAFGGGGGGSGAKGGVAQDIGGGGGGGYGGGGGGSGVYQYDDVYDTLMNYPGWGQGGKGAKDGKTQTSGGGEVQTAVPGKGGEAGSAGSSGSMTAEKTVKFVGLEGFLTVRWSFGDGQNVHVLEGDSFTVPAGATSVKVMFGVPDCFALDGDASVNLGTVNSDVTFGGTGGRPVPTVVVPYLWWDEVKKKLLSDSVPITACTIVSDGTRTLDDGGWYVVMDDVGIGSGLVVNGTAHLVLCDGASLTVEGVPVGQAGIAVETGASLTICGQSGASGTLTVSGGTNAAGIGGGTDDACGTITIDGGTVVAAGGTGADGIGAGRWGEPGTVTTHGGHVTDTHGPAAVTEDGAVFDGVLVVGGEVLRSKTADAVFKVAGAERTVTLTTDADGRFAAKIPGVAEDATSVELVKVGETAVSGKIMRLPRVTYALVAAEADAVVSDGELSVVDGAIEVTGDLTVEGAIQVDEGASLSREAVSVSEVTVAKTNDLYGVRADGGRIRWIGQEEQVLDAEIPKVVLNVGGSMSCNELPWYACLTMGDGTALAGDTVKRYFGRENTEQRAKHFDVCFMNSSATAANFPPVDPEKDASAFDNAIEDNVFEAPGDGFCRLRLHKDDCCGGIALTLRVEERDGETRDILNPGWVQAPSRFKSGNGSLERSYTFAVRKGDRVHLRLLYSEGYTDGAQGRSPMFGLDVQMYFRRLGTVKE